MAPRRATSLAAQLPRRVPGLPRDVVGRSDVSACRKARAAWVQAYGAVQSRRAIAMKHFVLAGLVAVMLAGTGTVALADQPPATTFVFVLTAAQEVPTCGPADNAARGV